MANKVILMNDSTDWYHFGCTATSLSLKSELSKRGVFITSVPITETYKLNGAPKTVDLFNNLDIYKIFCNANKKIITEITQHDTLIINGEGTLHGINQAPLNLLYIAYITKKFLNKRVEIINHSVYPQDNLILDNTAITNIYTLVYSSIDYIAIREPASFRLMQKLKIQAVQSFDCLPLYIINQYIRHNKKENKKLLVAGSAAWIAPDITSKGDIQHYSPGLVEFAKYLDHMYAQGYSINFLYGASKYPAQDDKLVIDTIKSNLKNKLKIIEVNTTHEWLSHIESASILVSGRFHHTIAAACLNTNFIMLNSNTPKIEGLKEMLHCRDIIQYQDPQIRTKLLEQTNSIAKSNKNIPKSDYLCKMASHNFPQDS